MDRIEQHLDNLYEDFFHMDFLYSEFAKRYGESYYSMTVLGILNDNPNGISQKQLCQMLFLPKQTVGSIMSGFERRGLATHRQDQLDRRSKLHVLTKEGKRYCGNMMGALRRIELTCVQQIGEDDMNKAHEITKRYLNSFKQALDSTESDETS